MERYKTNIEGGYTNEKHKEMFFNTYNSDFYDKINILNIKDYSNGVEILFEYDKKVENPGYYFDKYKKPIC